MLDFIRDIIFATTTITTTIVAVATAAAAIIVCCRYIFLVMELIAKIGVEDSIFSKHIGPKEHTIWDFLSTQRIDSKCLILITQNESNWIARKAYNKNGLPQYTTIGESLRKLQRSCRLNFPAIYFQY